MIREYLVHRLIGTPLEKPARKLRELALGPIEAARGRGRSAELLREPDRIVAAMKLLVRPRMNCVDVGSGLGASVARIVELSPNGRHMAVEADPRRARWLAGKFPGVTVHATVLGDRVGHIDRTVRGKRVSLPIDRLDHLIAEDRFIHFMGLWTAGQELAVLRGAERTLRRCRPALLLECVAAHLHRHRADPMELFGLLKAQGYVVYRLREFVAHGSPLDEAGFERAITPPVEANHLVAVSRPRPRSRRDRARS